MTDELASAAAGVGAGWPLLAPAVGALGTFVTGSATASNILFTDFQQATAEAQGRPVLPLLGAQGFGAAVGNIICPAQRRGRSGDGRPEPPRGRRAAPDATPHRRLRGPRRCAGLVVHPLIR